MCPLLLAMYTSKGRRMHNHLYMKICTYLDILSYFCFNCRRPENKFIFTCIFLLLYSDRSKVLQEKNIQIVICQISKIQVLILGRSGLKRSLVNQNPTRNNTPLLKSYKEKVLIQSLVCPLLSFFFVSS